MKYKFYDVADLMTIFKVKNNKTILGMIHRGELIGTKCGNKWLVHEKALHDWYKENTITPPSLGS